MKTAVMTDSNSGLSANEADSIGIWSIPMPVLIDGQSYFEGVDLSDEVFFRALTEGKAVTTSQPSPGAVCAMWDDILSQGYDNVVYIPMSSSLSHSCETAQLASAEYGGRVCVVDNRRVSVTQRASAMDALKMARQGMPAAHIRSALENRADRTGIYLAVDDLGYLVRGGRTTPAAATLASVLKIKPVLTIQGGRVEPFSKERGMKKAVAKMLSAAKHDMKQKVDNKREIAVVGVACAGVSEEREQEFLQMAQEEFPNAEVFYNRLPFSVAVHTGPGAMGIGIHSRERE